MRTMQRSDLYDFWFLLAKHLTDLGLPMNRRTDRVLDIGFGEGYRALVDDHNRITHPSGRFINLASLDPRRYAVDLNKAYWLSKRESDILDLIRHERPSSNFSGSRIAVVGGSNVRVKTLDRLQLLGLIKEQSGEERSCSDVSYRICFPDNLPKRMGGVA